VLPAKNGEPIVYVSVILEMFYQLCPQFSTPSSCGKCLNIAYHDQTVTSPGQKDVETFWR